MEPVCTHFHWGIRDGYKNASRRQAILLNTVEQGYQRISFSDNINKARSNLVVCHSNENVDRCLKRTTEVTFLFRKNILKRNVKCIYKPKRN